MTSNQAALIQFIKYALAGGLATLTHIIVFHLVGWKFFPSLQAKDHAVKFFKLSIRTVSDATRARNSMIGNGIAFFFALNHVLHWDILLSWRGQHHPQQQ